MLNVSIARRLAARISDLLNSVNYFV